MNIAVCFNLAPAVPLYGEQQDHISEAGAELEAEAVVAALKLLGHTPTLVPLGAQISTFVGALVKLQPQLVFNLCEGFWGQSSREMHVAALLELLGLTHTGSPPLTLGLTQNKALTKDLLVRHKLPTPNYLLLEPGAALPQQLELSWPLIVKPCLEDASIGIGAESVVSDLRALLNRIAYIHAQYRQGALVEEFIAGREFNAAVIGDCALEALPVAEICFQSGLERQIVSYAGKWLEDSTAYVATAPVCPALVSAQEAEAIQAVALRACHLLGCRDYARVDIRMRDGIPYILEVNANPDISPDAGLARAAHAAGLEYPALIGRILELSLTRMENTNA
ncbi:MAG: ATP-grasp domain-containing protein [Desulfuromonadaceae bacterium]|nr:ATP-grasp domain-containing protein [Desulfuromonadaceae bacterium]